MRHFSSKRMLGSDGLGTMMAASDAALSKAVIDLSLGDPDLDTDAAVIEKAFEDAKRGFTHYAPALGDPDLIDAIRVAWHEDYGIGVDENRIMVTASGCHAMWLLLSAILDPGDEVVVFAPYFPPYPDQIEAAGGAAVIVGTDPDGGFTPDADALGRAIGPHTKAVIVNTPCNPTGACLTREQMEPLLAICVNHELLLIADDIYTAYDFGSPFVPFAGLAGSDGCVATVKSFSKDYCMSGWRVGYTVAPPDVIAAMRKVNESNVFTAPIVSQRAALHALNARTSIRACVHDTYEKRMAYALSRVAGISGVDASPSSGSLYLFLDVRNSGFTDEAFAAALLERERISVIPGSAFGDAGRGFVRIALRVDVAALAFVFDAIERITAGGEQEAGD